MLESVKLDDVHYHDSSKKCKVVFKLQYGNDPSMGKILEGKYCVTHSINLCKCKWEWKFHYGVDTTEYVFDAQEAVV